MKASPPAVIAGGLIVLGELPFRVLAIKFVILSERSESKNLRTVITLKNIESA